MARSLQTQGEPDARQVAAKRAPVPVPILIGGALLILLLIGLLIELDISRNRIESQEKIAQRAEQRSEPVLESSGALIRDFRELSPELRRTFSSFEELPAVFDSVQDAAIRLPYAVNTGVGVLEDVNRSAIIASTAKLLAQIERADLVASADKASQSVLTLTALQQKLLRLQKRSYRETVRSRAIQENSLAVQRESLKHVRSLDLKTGGTISP